jgi:3-hydroxybutyryl-CoA dehydratase
MNLYRFEDISIGMAEEFKTFVTDEMMEKFLKISGDTNPLHINSNYAIQKGFANRVVYGMLVSAFYSKLAGVYLPGRNCLLHGIDISFNKPTYVGDALTVRGEIVYLNNAYRMIEIKANIKNQYGIIVSKAMIKAGIL